jgi:hypothetical protein
MRVHRSIGLTLVLVLAACGVESPSGSVAGEASERPLPAAVESGAPYEPTIEPADFVDVIDNPYFPLRPGSRWVLEGSGDADGEVDTVTVLEETRVVMGVECLVVRDEVSQDGEPVEITDDWYAQDRDGNVWYFGEETAEYENGEVVSTGGSWEAGVDGAQPGIIMPAEPVVGAAYRQEFYAGEAEDMAVAVELGQRVEIAAGSFDNVLVTEDWTPLEPDVRERKSYAPGVGLITEQQIAGGSSAFELVEWSIPDGG